MFAHPAENEWHPQITAVAPGGMYVRKATTENNLTRQQVLHFVGRRKLIILSLFLATKGAQKQVLEIFSRSVLLLLCLEGSTGLKTDLYY